MTRPLSYFLFIAIIFLASCSDDSCLLEDWTGTYVGTKTTGSEVQVDYTFTVSANDPSLLLPLNSIVLDDIYFTVDDCNISGIPLVTTLQPLVAFGKLKGNELNITIESTTFTCSWFGKKQ